MLKLSPEFHSGRLEELYHRCEDGLILLRGEWDWFRKREVRSFDPSYRDTDFKQEKNLYYLTGLEIPNCFVLIDPRRRQFNVYTDWHNPRELENARALGVDRVKVPCSFLRDVRIYGEQYENLYTVYTPLLEHGPMFTKNAVMTGMFPPGMGEPLTEEMQFARRLSELFPSHHIKSLCPVLDEMRKIKQPEEIRLLRAANKASVQGVLEALKAIRPGLYNHDISAVIDYTFRREGAVGLTFADNLMSGPHQFTKLDLLWADYSHLDRELIDGEGIFIDVGAEVGYYLSDIGRTAPVAGRFTQEQRQLYEAYLPCYLRALRSIRPGTTQQDLVRECVSTMEYQLANMKEDWLRKAGQDFITMTRNRPALGHYIDMDVIGKGAVPDEPLKPGMVFAIEPLLFCAEMKFAVFVEDNVVVTQDGYEILSSGLPYAAEEIETIMAKSGMIDNLQIGAQQC